jgi:hypothetical protein
MNTDDVWTDVWVYEYWSKPSYIQNGNARQRRKAKRAWDRGAAKRKLTKLIEGGFDKPNGYITYDPTIGPTLQNKGTVWAPITWEETP